MLLDDESQRSDGGLPDCHDDVSALESQDLERGDMALRDCTVEGPSRRPLKRLRRAGDDAKGPEAAAAEARGSGPSDSRR